MRIKQLAEFISDGQPVEPWHIVFKGEMPYYNGRPVGVRHRDDLINATVLSVAYTPALETDPPEGFTRCQQIGENKWLAIGDFSTFTLKTEQGDIVEIHAAAVETTPIALVLSRKPDQE